MQRIEYHSRIGGEGQFMVVRLGGVLVLELNCRQMPEQDMVCMQGPFRRACRARRVNEPHRVLSSADHWGKSVRRVGKEALVVQDAISICTVDTDDMLQTASQMQSYAVICYG